MCRFVVYAGRDMRMSDLLTESAQSLIHQSYAARERAEPLNGDGFGVGWYGHETDSVPGVFTSIRPAWSDRNLHRLARRIHSGCFFAHVRAATPGMPVSELNCHPFLYRRYLWMHNGFIAEFRRLRRGLLASLPDDLFHFIQGNGDTELIFALFLHQLSQLAPAPESERYAEAMKRTLSQLRRAADDAGIETPSFFNIAFTDGRIIIATRHADRPGVVPETLYTSAGDRFTVENGQYRMQPEQDGARALIIASEPLTGNAEEWRPVPPGHMLVVSPELELATRPLND